MVQRAPIRRKRVWQSATATRASGAWRIAFTVTHQESERHDSAGSPGRWHEPSRRVFRLSRTSDNFFTRRPAMATTDLASAPAAALSAGSLLTDELLARLRRARARATTGRTASSPRTSRSCATPATCVSPCRAELGGLGCRSPRSSASSGGSPTTPRRPRSRSTCTSTGSASPPTSGAPATRSLQWVLEEAARGDVFAAGHAESGNDIPVLLSTTRAERVDGGYRFTGHKSFGSLTPVWTYLGLHGMDTQRSGGAEDRPRLHAARHGGLPDRETWDVLGHARDAQRRHDPRRRLRARPLRRARRPGRRGRDRSLRARRCSPGRCSGSATSTTAWRAARSTSRVEIA